MLAHKVGSFQFIFLVLINALLNNGGKHIIQAFPFTVSSSPKPTTLQVVSSPRMFSKNAKVVEDTASVLLKELIESWNGGNIESLGANDKQRIDDMIRILVDSKSKFDPDECLFGDFFMTIYVSGTTPLWEKIAQIAPSVFGNKGPKNIKGQKYYIDFESNDEGQPRVINYAEVFGTALQLRAYGQVVEKSSNNDVEPKSTTPTPVTSSPINSFLTFLKDGLGTDLNTNDKKSKGGLLDCPVDYIANIEKGTIVFLNNELDIKVEGTGTVRVLYADSNMRVFVNVEDDPDARWEKDGVLVVQVRAKLVDPEFQDISTN